MLRRLYRCVVRLHPSSFRQRFGNEMLYIFDQKRGTLAVLGATLDCIFSLLRQWTLRPHVSVEPSSFPLERRASDHIPSFGTLEPSQPSASAIIHGTLLSLILFYGTVVAIRYSWIHVLNLHIPEISANPTQPLSWDSKNSSKHLTVDVIPTEAENHQNDTLAASSSRTPVTPVPPRRVTIWLDLYVGKYVSNYPPTKIAIQIEGDHLSLAAGRQRFILVPASRTRFMMAGVENSYVDFAADAEGGIRSLSWAVNGNVIIAQRQ